MYYSRAAVVVPLVDVPAASSGDPKVCTKFNASLRLFEKLPSSPSSGSLRTVSGEIIECFHVGEEPLTAGVDVLAVQNVDEVWVTECSYEFV